MSTDQATSAADAPAAFVNTPVTYFKDVSDAQVLEFFKIFAEDTNDKGDGGMILGSHYMVPVTVCGCSAVGKSSLTTMYVADQFPEDYNETIIDNHRKAGMFCNERTSLDIFDTAGSDQYQCTF